MSTRKRGAWIACDGEYLGVVGADSLDQMAEIIAEQRETGYVHEALREHEERPVDPTDLVALRAWLDIAPVQPVIVPAAYLSQEQWDGSLIYPTEIGARPGRGRAKVLGINLTSITADEEV